jgi:transporter family protein
MEIETQAILFALVAFLGFGISNVLQKVYVRKLTPSRLNIYRNGVLSLILLVATLVFSRTVVIDWEAIAFAIGVSAVSYFGLYFINKGLNVGDAGVIVPITSSRIIISSMIGVLFLNDPISNFQFIAILVILAGLVVLTVDFQKLKNSALFDPKSGVIYGLLTAVFWGVTFPYFSIPSAILGGIFFGFILETTVFVMSLLQTKALGQRIIPTRQEVTDVWVGVVSIAVLGAAASVFQNFAYATGRISIVTAIVGASPLVTVIVGRIFLDEKLSLKQYFGVLMIVAGIVAVSLL